MTTDRITPSPIPPDTGASEPKTQARHALDLIADYYDGEGEGHRAFLIRSLADHALLEGIKMVLVDLSNTTAAYMNEKGSQIQQARIETLESELANAVAPDGATIERLNAQIATLNARIDGEPMVPALDALVVNAKCNSCGHSVVGVRNTRKFCQGRVACVVRTLQSAVTFGSPQL